MFKITKMIKFFDTSNSTELLIYIQVLNNNEYHKNTDKDCII